MDSYNNTALNVLDTLLKVPALNEKVLNEATTLENTVGIFILDRLTKEH